MAYLRLPDGSYTQVPDGISEQEATALAQQKFPELYGMKGPESGFLPSLLSGVESLKGETALTAGKLGLMDLAKAEKYQKEKEAAAQRIYKPTEQGWTEAPITKTAELLGGSIPYVAAPVIAGAVAPEGLLAAGATGLASGAQFIGSNLARQLDTGKSLEQASLGKAALAAIPQAALDTVSLHMIPGVRQIFGAAGMDITEEMAKKIAEQGIGRTLASYAGAGVKASGTEGLTEAAQQVFERLQAGLNITDPEARKEYFDNFVGGAVLGGTLAAPGHYVERGQAIEKGAALGRARVAKESQAAQAEAAAQREAQLKDPEYLTKLNQDYLDSKAKLDELRAAVPKKPGADADEADRLAYQEAVDARKTYERDTHAPLAREWHAAKPALQPILAKQAAETARQQNITATPIGATIPLGLEQTASDKQLEKVAAAQQKQNDIDNFDALNTQYKDLRTQVQALQDAHTAEMDSPTPDYAKIKDIGQQLAAIRPQYGEIEKRVTEAKKSMPSDATEESLRRQAAKALENDKFDVHAKIMDQLQKLQAAKAFEAAQPKQAEMFTEPTPAKPIPEKAQMELGLPEPQVSEKPAVTPEEQAAPGFQGDLFGGPLPKAATPERAPAKPIPEKAQMELGLPEPQVSEKPKVTPEEQAAPGFQGDLFGGPLPEAAAPEPTPATTPKPISDTAQQELALPEPQISEKPVTTEKERVKKGYQGDLFEGPLAETKKPEPKKPEPKKAATTEEKKTKAEAAKATVKEEKAVKDTVKSIKAALQEVINKRGASKEDKRLAVETMTRLDSKKENDTPEKKAATMALARENAATLSERNANKKRTAEGQTKGDFSYDEAAKLIDAAKAKLGEDIKLTYVAEYKNTPVRIIKEMREGGTNFEEHNGPGQTILKGTVLPSGEIVIWGNPHSSMLDFEQSIVHEIVGHRGVDGLLGHARFMQLAKATDVDKLAEDLGIKEDIDRSVEGMAEKGATEDDIKLMKLQEVIAYLSERRVNETIMQKAGRLIKEIVAAARDALRKLGFVHADKLSTSDLYRLLKQSHAAFNEGKIGARVNPDGSIKFNYGQKRTGDGTPELSMFSKQNKNWWDKVKGANIGLEAQTRYVDQYAPVQAASKLMGDTGKASQMMYYVRMAAQRMGFAAQVAGNGTLNLVKKPDGSYVIESTKGANLHNISKILKKAGIKDSAKLEQMFTAYLAGKRAMNKGWERLNFSNPAAVKADYDAVMNYLGTNKTAADAFEEARKEYNEYNKGLVNFAVQTGRLSKQQANSLLADSDYVPFYRNNNGDVEMVLGNLSKEKPIVIGNLKDQPYLQELIGGNEEILPFMTSAIQNTVMMTDLGLRNQATKDVVFNLFDTFGPDAVTIGKKGGNAGPNVLRFYDNGVEKHAVLNKQFFDTIGIPAELLVTGMEGIKTTLPMVVRMLGIPARFLRHMVTRNPMYALRQLLRDSFSATMLSGANITPVASAVKELASMVRNKNETEIMLANRGIIGGQVMTGTAEDMQTILRDAAAGKTSWNSVMSKLDSFSMKADAATRVAMYNSFIKQGMSEMEATLATLESMNFNKRGISPSIHWLNTMIPFMNAQIQGLNVVYQAFTKGMTGEARVQATRKLMLRGMLMVASTLAYAAMMQDDKDYKDLTPDERWQYWFFRLPGQKEPLRIPIPFEIGVLFKALPETLVNAMDKDSQGKQVNAALRHMVMSNIPGGIPQAVKGPIEVATNHDFFTGKEIENKHEQSLDSAQRFRDTNSELSKFIGQIADVSPRMIDHIMNSYMSGTGMALVKMMDPAFIEDTEGPARAKLKPTQEAGGSFLQGTEGYGLINGVYDYMMDVQKAKSTFDDMVKSGRRADALAFLQENEKRLREAPLAQGYLQQMKKLSELESKVRKAPADAMTPEKKRETLDFIQERRKELAKVYRPYTA